MNFVFFVNKSCVLQTTKRKNEDNLDTENNVKKVKTDQNKATETMKKRLLDYLA